jgi:Ca2+/H+ antiporter
MVSSFSLSWVTEQVALHTNQTIGALLNATFGNAPELLISVAALRSGYYRVVQLAMLGSMLTNMILIFGISCIIGGLRWQVQEIRLTSGNVSVGMLLVATAGSLFPAILILSGQFPEAEGPTATALDLTRNSASRDRPSQEEITLSRVNAAVMFILYLCYLVFQLGTHKDEFDDDDDDNEVDDDVNDAYVRRRKPAQRNLFCQNICAHVTSWFADGNEPVRAEDRTTAVPLAIPFRDVLTKQKRKVSGMAVYDTCDNRSVGSENENEDGGGDCELGDLDDPDPDDLDNVTTHELDENLAFVDGSDGHSRRRKAVGLNSGNTPTRNPSAMAKRLTTVTIKSKNSDTGVDGLYLDHSGHSHIQLHEHHQPLISMRVGMVWLFVITLCISAMSDVLVGTIDGFAARMQLSEVFTSMVVIPFFSNVAEQVSAFIFAYRNEMDLCVGVTIGSAIQIATFVLPGSVLIGMLMDRSMTLYFHSYETACLFFCTVLVAAVLQGGSTNWLVGAMLVGVYIMFAAGIWFHEIEILSIDEDSATDGVSMGINETQHAI